MRSIRNKCHIWISWRSSISCLCWKATSNLPENCEVLQNIHMCLAAEYKDSRLSDSTHENMFSTDFLGLLFAEAFASSLCLSGLRHPQCLSPLKALLGPTCHEGHGFQPAFNEVWGIKTHIYAILLDRYICDQKVIHINVHIELRKLL